MSPAAPWALPRGVAFFHSITVGRSGDALMLTHSGKPWRHTDQWWPMHKAVKPFQYAEEVTRGESPRRSRDQRVHRNPVTFVTPTVSMPGIKWFSRQTTTDSIEKRMDSQSKEAKR
jgi:hypothetical protein